MLEKLARLLKRKKYEYIKHGDVWTFRMVVNGPDSTIAYISAEGETKEKAKQNLINIFK